MGVTGHTNSGISKRSFHIHISSPDCNVIQLRAVLIVGVYWGGGWGRRRVGCMGGGGYRWRMGWGSK